MVFFFVLGRVCVPIDPNRCEEFDPTAVPTLSQVNLFYNDNILTCVLGRGKPSIGFSYLLSFQQGCFCLLLESIRNLHNSIKTLSPPPNTFSCGKGKHHLLTWLEWVYNWSLFRYCIYTCTCTIRKLSENFWTFLVLI